MLRENRSAPETRARGLAIGMRFLVVFAACLAGCPLPVTETGDPPDTSDTGPVPTVEITVLGYNVESGDSVPSTTAEYIREVQGEVLWGFSETLNASWLTTFAEAAADDGSQDFQTLLGTTGFSDRLGIVWDDNILEMLGSTELDNINVGGTVRAPLVARFRIRESGTEFKFMVNHLWRTDSSGRFEQAQLLNQWAAAETLPVIAVGDYNFDWAVEGGDEDHDAAYDELIADDVWTWVRPDPLIATQCNFSYNSVLDFTFVANGAQGWASSSDILFPENVYCQDTPEKPDHRPVQARFTIPLGP